MTGNNTSCIWTQYTIKDFIDKGEVELQTGPFGTQLHASDYVETGTPMINARNIGFGEIRTEKLEYLSEGTVKRLSSHLLHTNDLVFGRKGTVERHVLIRPEYDGWFQGTDCLRIRFKSKSINPRFVSYTFLTDYHKQWMINQSSHGATMTSLNQGIISRIPLNLPDIEIQNKIASILSAYDDLIKNNNRRIKILEEMAQMIYREWYVKFRFPGHDGVRMMESELGPVPDGWEVRRLGDICNITMGQSPNSEYYNETGNGLPFHQGVTNFGARFPVDKIYCTIRNRIAEPGDILFSVRAPVGRINLADKKIVIGRGLSAIRHKNGNQLFTYQQLKEIFQEEDTIGGGTIFKSVTKEDMHNIQVLTPDSHFIERFEENVEPISLQMDNLIKKNVNLRRTRDLLLPKLISGVLDVSELDIRIP